MPVAEQGNGNNECEPGLSTELSVWSRLFRRVLESFTGVNLKIPCFSKTYL